MPSSQSREPAWPLARSASMPAESVRVHRQVEAASPRHRLPRAAERKWTLTCRWRDEPGLVRTQSAWRIDENAFSPVTTRVCNATNRRSVQERRRPYTRHEPISRWHVANRNDPARCPFGFWRWTPWVIPWAACCQISPPVRRCGRRNGYRLLDTGSAGPFARSPRHSAGDCASAMIPCHMSGGGNRRSLKILSA